MDDTKKLIEKYKRELMELSRSAPRESPVPREAPVPQETPVPRTFPVPQESPVSSGKTPRVIGYVEEDIEVPEEYNRLVEEIADSGGEYEDTDEIYESEDELVDESDEAAVETVVYDEDLPNEPQPRISPENRPQTTPPADDEMARGSRSTAGEFTEPVYDSYEQFSDSNIGNGTITFRVYTAREALPIEGARCVLSKRLRNSSHQIASLLTNESGQTPPQSLPAPSKEYSQQVENKIQPFSLYDASVTKEGFAEVILNDIPIFDGIQSIQNVSMIPAQGETEIITEVPDANK